MGSVWRAHDQHLSIDVAIKLIDSALVDSPDALARFQREALAAAGLRCTNIVHVTDYGVDDGTPFIAMDLLEGESLATRLNRLGKLSFEQTLNVLSQVAEALTFAHDKRIVHRDLKPDNVFITPEGRREVVKVLDFGVAKKLGVQSSGEGLRTHTGILLGTPYYMSPEQTRSSSTVDHRTDIWSLGVIAFECVTGRRPFSADTLPDLLIAICRDPVPPPSTIVQVPSGFDEWFARATAREVNERFRTAAAAAQGLLALAQARITRPAQAVAAGPTSPAIATATVVAPRRPSERVESMAPSAVTAHGGMRRPRRIAVAGAATAAALVFVALASTVARSAFERSPPASSVPSAAAAAPPSIAYAASSPLPMTTSSGVSSIAPPTIVPPIARNGEPSTRGSEAGHSVGASSSSSVKASGKPSISGPQSSPRTGKSVEKPAEQSSNNPSGI